MIDYPAVDLAPAAARRRRPRRLWIMLVAVLVLVAAGSTTAVSISMRYLHATPFSTFGGGWLPPDGGLSRRVLAGPTSAMVVAPRPGHRQSFTVDLVNTSAVSQTILGLPDAEDLADPLAHAEPVHLAFSTTADAIAGGSTGYTSRPVTVPPGGQVALRFSIDTKRTWFPCLREYWSALSLHVRVGWFTRTEHVDFGTTVFELRQPGPC